MKMTLRKTVIAASTFACAALFSLGWLSVNKAEAYTRLHVWPHYAAGAVYTHSEGLSWHA